MARAAAAAPQIRSVWATNIDDEFELIHSFIDRYPIAAMDTEFPGVVFVPYCHSRYLSSTDHYSFLKTNVDKLNIIQLGLTLSDEAGRLPLVNGSPAIWEFNFKDFDYLKGDLFVLDSINMLISNGIDFNANRDRGIDSRDFASRLCSSGLLQDGIHDITWITFHGAYDFAYLVKALIGQELPATSEEFLRYVKIYFGERVLDVKHVMRRFKELYGGLDRVAELLDVKREVGMAHQAGSDSLLTMQVFLRMKTVHSLLPEDEEEDAGVIFGLDSMI